MRKYLMKPIVLVPALFVLMLIMSGCPTDPEDLTSAIFSDVTKIEISPISGSMNSFDYFTYDLPKEIKYAIVELFIGSIEIPDDPDKKIPLENLIAGSRTGLADFTRSSVRADKLFPLNADKTGFNTSIGKYIITGGPYTWIILGYDENMILTHASTAGKVTIN